MIKGRPSSDFCFLGLTAHWNETSDTPKHKLSTVFFLKNFFSHKSQGRELCREEAQLKYRPDDACTWCYPIHCSFSPEDTEKNPKGIKHNTSKRPQTSWPIKYLCVLLQNLPEKLVSPRLCPRQAAAQAHCRFAAVCGRWGLNWAQSRSQKIARGIPLRGIPNTGHYFSQRSSLSPCLFWGRERTAPSQQESPLAVTSVPCQTPCHPLHLTFWWHMKSGKLCAFLSGHSMKHPASAWQPSLGMF